jgi:hypothetical protein
MTAAIDAGAVAGHRNGRAFGCAGGNAGIFPAPASAALRRPDAD